MDETPSAPAEKSPQIKLTLPASEPIKNVFSRSASPSPTQKRKQLLPSTTNETRGSNLQTKCDTPLNVGSATGMYKQEKRKNKHNNDRTTDKFYRVLLAVSDNLPHSLLSVICPLCFIKCAFAPLIIAYCFTKYSWCSAHKNGCILMYISFVPHLKSSARCLCFAIMRIAEKIMTLLSLILLHSCALAYENNCAGKWECFLSAAAAMTNVLFFLVIR